MPISGSGFVAPVVLADKCVGCGLCQTRCYAINVKEKHLLTGSAIVIEAGLGKEDRLISGSYVQLRTAEKQQGKPATHSPAIDFFVPESPPASDREATSGSIRSVADDPFGLND
jgi:ferredoxin